MKLPESFDRAMRDLRRAQIPVYAGNAAFFLVLSFLPLLTLLPNLKDTEIFPASISIILPICLTSLARTPDAVIWQQALPYLLGSALGGLAAGKWGKKIPVLWLHRGLGILILWGGWRYLC